MNRMHNRLAILALTIACVASQSFASDQSRTRTVDDIPALTLIDSGLADGTVVRVSDPIAGGDFQLNKTDTTTTIDSGTVFPATVGRWKRIYNGTEVNVKWFNAKGDGTECATAFQAALDNHRHVYIPPGDYLISTDLHIKNRSVVRGDGWSSNLQLSGAKLHLDDRASGSIYPWTLKSFRVTRTGAAGPCIHVDGLTTSGVARGKIKDVIVFGSTGNGIDVEGCWILEIINPMLEACTDIGLNVQTDGASTGCNSLNVRGGEIHGCGTAVSMEESEVVNFWGTTIEGNTNGVDVLGTAKSTSFYACYFELNTNWCIRLGNVSTPSSVSLQDCQFKSNADYSVVVKRCKNLRIRGGSIAGNAIAGIHIDEAAVGGNNITGSIEGVYAADGTTPIIVNTSSDFREGFTLEGVDLSDIANDNLILNSAVNTIDTASGISRSVIGGGGETGNGNAIGRVTKPTLAHTAPIPAEWADDSDYPADGNAGSVATIAGGYDNVNNQIAGTISGGGHNYIKYDINGHSIVSGGSYNMIEAGRSWIGGGRDNVITGYFGALAGGDNNRIDGVGGFIGSGFDNIASGDHSSVLFGQRNESNGIYSATWGIDNVVDGDYSVATGRDAVNKSDFSHSLAATKKSISGDTQTFETVGGITTTNATLTSLSGGMTLDTSVITAGFGTVRLIGVDDTGNVAILTKEFGYRLNGSSASLIDLETGTVTTSAGPTLAIDNVKDEITVGACQLRMTIGAILIRATGKAATNIHWTGSLELTQTLTN